MHGARMGRLGDLGAPEHTGRRCCDPNPVRGTHSLVNRVAASGANIGASEAITVHEAIEATPRWAPTRAGKSI